MRKLTISVSLTALTISTAAEAYIGPGLGAGTIAVVLGIIVAIFMAFVAVLWYPVKRLIKRRKAARPGASSAGEVRQAKAGSESP